MTLPDKLSPGMVLGRYELLLPIAQGGMATVWAARQKGSRGFQKTVAIKTMLPALSDDPQFEQMFLDEAALASRIHHPNVAEILDVGEQDEVIYMVMEWVDGEALSVLTKTAKKNNITFSQRIALRIVRQACGGLHAAHELRDESGDQLLELVHRDVSPQNILVSYDGIVKMVDFGVAKALGRAAGETTAGQLKGKVPYMSPEQALGKKIDRRTDIFAMGIVLYRLTTGLHPFLGESDIVTMKNIISRPVLPPRMKNPSFPAELERVLLTCLKKDANERYQTMLELDAAIERVLAIAGASVVDDDIGGFVRSVMGDRGQKRRGALRDAVRAADERAAGIAATPHSGSSPVMPHEGVTDIALTGINTALTSVPTNLNSMAPASILPPMPEGYEGTGVAHGMPGSMLPTDPFTIPRERGRTGVFLALGAVGILAVGGTILALKSASTPPVAATRTEATPSATQAAPTTPPTPAPTPTPAPIEAASAAPVADPATSAASINANDLPSADPKTDTKTDSKTDTKKTASSTKSSTGGAATTTTPTTTSTTKKNWVPGVQDPGF